MRSLVRSKFTEKIGSRSKLAIGVAGAATIAIAAVATGFFQLLEWAAYDTFFAWRGPEPADDRVVIVTIDEADLVELGRWPLSDRILADTLSAIAARDPAAIGLDLYRDLPIEPGSEELKRVLRETPNIIGVEKAIGDTVAPPPTLAARNRIGFADIVVDADGKVRRSLLSYGTPSGTFHNSLAVRLSELYLKERGIEARYVDDRAKILRWGKAKFVPFTGSEGGYTNTDWGGYQILLNYRGHQEAFITISISDVLEGNIPPDLMRDRVVFIGSIATSLKDEFYTPFSNHLQSSRTYGVVIHANAISQILSAAIDGRPLMRGIPQTWEWVWLAIAAWIGSEACWQTLNSHRHSFYKRVGAAILTIAAIVGSSYGAFLLGWWVPVVAPLFAAALGAIAALGCYHSGLQRMLETDSLTQVANRRAFEQFLLRTWDEGQRRDWPIAVVLCDIDFFKNYNDTYGHPAGDRCLRRVAAAIEDSTRQSDLVTRYGGEEFAVVLPDTDAIGVARVVDRICHRVKGLRLRHADSQVGPYVTLSCGAVSAYPRELESPYQLVRAADAALYKAKQEGRDTYRIYTAKDIT